MKRRTLWLAAAALVAWLVTANSLHARPAPADWREPRSLLVSSGLGALYPRSWQALQVDDSLVVASFPVSRAWTLQEHKRVPDGEIYIWVFSYGWLPPSRLFPSRPSHFVLAERDHGFYECGFGLEGYAVHFRERGLSVQAMVALGRGARPEDATAVLDRLVITRRIAPSLARS
jgi:hypothetical protein